MKLSTAESGPRMVLDVSSDERAIAKSVKEDFKKTLKKLDKAIDVVTDLKNAITEQRPSKDDLKDKYRGRLIRYRSKVRNIFNEFLQPTRKSLEDLSKVSDPEMIRLREIIVAEVGELSDGAEALLDLLEDPDKEGFTKTLEQLSAQIEKRKKSIIDVIDSQLFNHIDHDILGKMKISELHYNMRRRARIIRQLVRNS